MQALGCLFAILPLLSQQTPEPYYEYVRTEAGVTPYGGGCYPDKLLAPAVEGLVHLQITHCGTPPAAQTSSKLEWTAPPRILNPYTPFAFTLKVTLTQNLTPSWTLRALMGVSVTEYATESVWFSNAAVTAGPAGNPQQAGAVFTYDNLAKPGEGLRAPVERWVRTNPTGMFRVNFAAMGSTVYWWSYVYRLVEPKPKVTTLVSGASFRPGFAPGAWVTILGDTLATTTRSWAAADIVNGRLPTKLDGVEVTIDGKAAYIAYVSPGQLNILAPDDVGTGQVRVEVKNTVGSSESALAACQRFSPAAFAFNVEGGKHVIAHDVQGVFLARANLIAGLATRPAQPGEVFTMYATGLGVTNPPTPSDRVLTTAAPVANTVTVRIAGLGAEVLWAGKIGSGLYQINARVPLGTPAGEQALVVEAGGVASPAGSVLTIQR